MALKGLDNVKRALNVDVYNQMNAEVKGIYFKLLREVIKETPVDTGRAKNNWFLSVSAPSQETTTVKGGANFKELGKIPAKVLDKKVYFTNNLPYIGTLEYGGYSQPGSSKTIKGFSKQAPNGWVRQSMLRAANRVRAI